MDQIKHYQSIATEFDALKDRVQNFIGTAHWLTVGEWKEAILRSALRQRLPDTVRIGRGFIVTKGGTSTQCDILLYRSDAPVLFRDGDLVFLTPGAVLGVIEVKTRISKSEWVKVIEKLTSIRTLIGDSSSRCFLGIFAYDHPGDFPRTFVRRAKQGASYPVKVRMLQNLTK